MNPRILLGWKPLLIAACGLLFFLPLYWISISAARPEADIFRYISSLSTWTFVPNHVTCHNILELWTGSFRGAILNSLLVSSLTVIGGLAVCAPAAFALAVIEFRGRKIVFGIMIISFLIPFDAIALPLYYVMRDLGFQDTYTGLVLPGIGNGLAVFLLRQFFMAIPRELSEAAKVDGLGWFQIFWRIYMPLSLPALFSAALILFIFQWQAYLWPLLIAPSTDYKLAAVAITQYSTTVGTNFGLTFAGAFFISLIPMILLIVSQRYYVRSVAATGGKE